MEECRNCGEEDLKHQDDHKHLCCDCFDLSLGMPLDIVNAERAIDGKSLLKPWDKHAASASSDRNEAGALSDQAEAGG